MLGVNCGTRDSIVRGGVYSSLTVVGDWRKNSLKMVAIGLGYARLSSSTGMVRTSAVWRAYSAKPG